MIKDIIMKYIYQIRGGARLKSLKQLLDIQSRKLNDSNFSHYFPGNDKIFIKRLIWKISNKLLSNSVIILKR